jgi:hypothetical protein
MDAVGPLLVDRPLQLLGQLRAGLGLAVTFGHGAHPRRPAITIGIIALVVIRFVLVSSGRSSGGRRRRRLLPDLASEGRSVH